MIMLSLGVTACGDTSTDEVTQISGEESAAVTASETSASTGTIVTSVGRYIFKPTNCAIGVEQGIKDIEIGGPGANPDGKPIYVTYSSTADSLDIQLGVDKPSASSEHELVAGRSV